MRFCLVLWCWCSACAATLPALDADGRQALAQVSHLVVVTTANWMASDAQLTMWERSAAGWRRTLGPVDAVVGARGLSWGRGLTRPPPEAQRIKKEGDRTAPAGVFRLGKVIGYASRPPEGVKLPYEQATAQMRCVDDPEALTYNRIAFAPAEGDPPWRSAEFMRRDDALYERLVLIGHNGLLGEPQPVPSAGSCIFLHVWREPGDPTIGCTALSLEHLDRVLRAIPSFDDVLFVQLPAAEHRAAVGAGWLPE